MRRLKTVSLVLLALVVPGGGAWAQEPGVIIDDGSPSGKEYALPFEEARENGSGSPDENGANNGGDSGAGADATGGSGEAGSTPLFGEGISSDRSDAGGSQDGREQRSRGVAARRSRDPLDGERLAAAGSADGPPAAIAGEGSSTAWPIAIALAVLATGGLAGLALKRRTREQGL